MILDFHVYIKLQHRINHRSSPPNFLQSSKSFRNSGFLSTFSNYVSTANHTRCNKSNRATIYFPRQRCPARKTTSPSFRGQLPDVSQLLDRANIRQHRGCPRADRSDPSRTATRFLSLSLIHRENIPLDGYKYGARLAWASQSVRLYSIIRGASPMMRRFQFTAWLGQCLAEFLAV